MEFKQCKLDGIQFNNYNDFLRCFNFTDYIFNMVVFIDIKIEETHFNSCKLIDTDFTDAQAKKVVFKDCNLQDVIFSNTNLEQADFLSAYNFNITPLSSNHLKKAVFSLDNLSGLLQSKGIMIKS